MEQHKPVAIFQVTRQVHRLHARRFHLPIRPMETIIKHHRKWVIPLAPNEPRATITPKNAICYGKQQRERYKSLPERVLESQATENDMGGMGSQSLSFKARVSG